MSETKTRIESQIVELDNKAFHDVTMKDCTLIFSGGRPPLLRNVDFDGCSFRLEGPALNTAEFIGTVARGGGEGVYMALAFIGLNPAAVETLTKQATSNEPPAS